jgi:hypothetical protein
VDLSGGPDEAFLSAFPANPGRSVMVLTPTQPNRSNHPRVAARALEACIRSGPVAGILTMARKFQAGVRPEILAARIRFPAFRQGRGRRRAGNLMLPPRLQCTGRRHRPGPMDSSSRRKSRSMPGARHHRSQGQRLELRQAASAHMEPSGVATPWQAYVHLRLEIFQALLADDQVILDHVPIPPAQVHRIRGEEDPRHAAREHDALLRARSFVGRHTRGRAGRDPAVNATHRRT